MNLWHLCWKAGSDIGMNRDAVTSSTRRVITATNVALIDYQTAGGHAITTCACRVVASAFSTTIKHLAACNVAIAANAG